MTRLLAVLTALVLLTGLVPARAGGLSLPEGSLALSEGESVRVDLDGDGTDETVRWAMLPNEFDPDGRLTLKVDAAAGPLAYDTEILYGGRVYIVDLDGDGRREILLTGDLMSDDYATWCLRYAGGELYELLFPDAGRGESGDGYFKSGYGEITDIRDSLLVLTGSQDVLGTWPGSRAFALAPSGRFEFNDSGIWVRSFDGWDEDDAWEYAALTLKTALPWHTGPDGGDGGVLQPGERIMVYASDKREWAWFATRDGSVNGLLAISPNYGQGWGWLVDGVPEEDCFEYVPYAD